MMNLTEGTKAPIFKGMDENGNIISLQDFKGKRVILFFYPKDDTEGCTKQACNLRDNYNILLKKGFIIIGINADTTKSHKKFKEKYTLPFILIADEDKKIIEKYKVWGEKKFMGRTFMGIIRTTFLIDEKGIIKKIISKPNTANHTQQILKTWEE